MVDLEADGADVAKSGVAAGHLRDWLHIRLPSLTHPAIAGLFQASAMPQTIPHPGTGLPNDFF